MRSRLIALLLVTLALPTCTHDTKSLSVDPILRFYGTGSATWAEGLAKATEGRPHGRYYELTLTKGIEEQMKQHFQQLQLPASNCAYLFYRGLSPAQKKAHSFVRITIGGQGQKPSGQFEFPMAHLAHMERSTALMERATQYLKAGAYDTLIAKGNAWGGSVASWQSMKSDFQQLDNRYGRVRRFSLQGFDYLTPTLGGRTRPLIRLAGVLMRDKQNTQFAWIVDPNAAPQSPYVYGVDFRIEMPPR